MITKNKIITEDKIVTKTRDVEMLVESKHEEVSIKFTVD